MRARTRPDLLERGRDAFGFTGVSRGRPRMGRRHLSHATPATPHSKKSRSRNPAFACCCFSICPCGSRLRHARASRRRRRRVSERWDMAGLARQEREHEHEHEHDCRGRARQKPGRRDPEPLLAAGRPACPFGRACACASRRRDASFTARIRLDDELHADGDCCRRGPGGLRAASPSCAASPERMSACQRDLCAPRKIVLAGAPSPAAAVP